MRSPRRLDDPPELLPDVGGEGRHLVVREDPPRLLLGPDDHALGSVRRPRLVRPPVDEVRHEVVRFHVLERVPLGEEIPPRPDLLDQVEREGLLVRAVPADEAGDRPPDLVVAPALPGEETARNPQGPAWSPGSFAVAETPTQEGRPYQWASSVAIAPDRACSGLPPDRTVVRMSRGA